MEGIPIKVIFYISAAAFVIVGVLIFLIIGKNETIEQLQTALSKLKKSFNELDEQAKLIVRTDLELNKAQEELDKRLKGLDTLQKTSRLISTTLDENEIFNRLQQSLLAEMGFEKNLVMLFDQQKKLYIRASYGLTEADIQYCVTNLETDPNLMKQVNEANTVSSVNAEALIKNAVKRIFDVDHYVLTSILTQNGIIGTVFVGNKSNTSPITEGDEELVSIMANQIGQALENARLFEEVYRSSQILETKVQDRTKQLASALEEVQNISKTKSEFISAVSHELRTPLTSIKGYAAILMNGKLGEIPDPVKERLGKINMHSDNLVGLINDLLDIARIESGRVAMNIGRCNLQTMIANVEDLLTPQMTGKNIKWASEVDKNIPEMQLDSSQIERVFINLISNAIKFTPEHGTISCIARLNKENVKLELSDTGIGISDDDIKKLFEEFYRVENKINQNVKGTGLGLALTKKIIEAHDGKIWVTSKLNEGTTFHISIPIHHHEKEKKNEDTLEEIKKEQKGDQNIQT